MNFVASTNQKSDRSGFIKAVAVNLPSPLADVGMQLDHYTFKFSRRFMLSNSRSKSFRLRPATPDAGDMTDRFGGSRGTLAAMILGRSAFSRFLTCRCQDMAQDRAGCRAESATFS